MSKFDPVNVPIVGLSINLGTDAENSVFDVVVSDITAAHDLSNLERALRARGITINNRYRQGDSATLTMSVDAEYLVCATTEDLVRGAATEARMMTNF